MYIAYILHVLLLQLSPFGGVCECPMNVFDCDRVTVAATANKMLNKIICIIVYHYELVFPSVYSGHLEDLSLAPELVGTARPNKIDDRRKNHIIFC